MFILWKIVTISIKAEAENMKKFFETLYEMARNIRLSEISEE